MLHALHTLSYIFITIKVQYHFPILQIKKTMSGEFELVSDFNRNDTFQSYMF